MSRRADAATRGDWAAAVATASLVCAELLAFGADGRLLASVAALLQLLLAAVMLLRSRPAPPAAFWRELTGPTLVLAAAMAWATAPLLVPMPFDLGGHRTADAVAVELLKLAGLAAGALTGALLALKRRRRQAFWVALTGLGAAYLLVVLSTRDAGVGSVWRAEHAQQGRLAGTLLNSNATACVCAVFSVIGFAALRDQIARLRSRRPGAAWSVVAAAAAFVLGLSCCLLAGSRFTDVALAVAVLALVALRRREGSGLAHARLGIAACVLVAIVAAVGALGGGGRWSDVGLDLGQRLLTLGSFLAMIARAPVFGYGLGSFAEAQTATMTAADAAQRWDLGAAHDIFVQAALEGGVPFLLLLTAAAVWPFAQAARIGVRGGGPMSAATAVAVLLAIGCSTLDIALNFPAVAFLTTVLAGVSWGRRHERLFADGRTPPRPEPQPGAVRAVRPSAATTPA